MAACRENMEEIMVQPSPGLRTPQTPDTQVAKAGAQENIIKKNAASVKKILDSVIDSDQAKGDTLDGKNFLANEGKNMKIKQVPFDGENQPPEEKNLSEALNILRKETETILNTQDEVDVKRARILQKNLEAFSHMGKIKPNGRNDYAFKTASHMRQLLPQYGQEFGEAIDQHEHPAEIDPQPFKRLAGVLLDRVEGIIKNREIRQSPEAVNALKEFKKPLEELKKSGNPELLENIREKLDPVTLEIGKLDIPLNISLKLQQILVHGFLDITNEKKRQERKSVPKQPETKEQGTLGLPPGVEGLVKDAGAKLQLAGTHNPAQAHHDNNPVTPAGFAGKGRTLA